MDIATSVNRPVLRYHGGKWLLAPWIISHFPEHRVYTEVFGGAASILMRKPRVYAEVYNDLDKEVVNVFKVLRDNQEELERLLRFTPFSREEFLTSYEYSEDPIEQARRTIIRSMMGFGSDAVTRRNRPTEKGFRTKAHYDGEYGEPMKTGFRSNSNRSGTTPAKDWANYPGHIGSFVERLTGVVIENREAKDILVQHDSEWTLHYVDPPYIHGTRFLKEKSNAYKHEMLDVDHEELLNVIAGLKGMIVLSGYENDLYNYALNGWRKEVRATHADGARDRVEVLWISPNVPARQPELFHD